MTKTISLRVNGKSYSGEVESRTLLTHFLRDTLRLTGTHVGCVVGRCGACTVLWNETAVKSCMVFAVQADGDEIVTVEGLAQDKRLHPLQESFWQKDAVECGYCTPGMLMSAYGLLSKVSQPTEEQIKKAISGNLCRCTGYGNIVSAIKEAAVSFVK
ncbi:MAG TPA: (2Fe-2S)-binding protein [Candidatus Binatia bacterium]|nr:(2Fe-2S)-binding protein [Candidatus Binatia bacterium]